MSLKGKRPRLEHAQETAEVSPRLNFIRSGRIPSYQFARGVISIIKIAVNALHRACPIRKFQVKDSAYND
jgi:hypothetical protein